MIVINIKGYSKKYPRQPVTVIGAEMEKVAFARLLTKSHTKCMKVRSRWKTKYRRREDPEDAKRLQKDPITTPKTQIISSDQDQE